MLTRVSKQNNMLIINFEKQITCLCCTGRQNIGQSNHPNNGQAEPQQEEI